MNEEIDDYLRELRKGSFEDIYFNLIDLDDSLVPDLIDAYWREASRDIRIILIEAIWQHRLPATLGFLGEVLRDNDPEIWKAALDGIVALNIQESIQALVAEKERLIASMPSPRERVEWIEETITQINPNLM